MKTKLSQLNWRYWPSILYWLVYLIGFFLIDNRTLTSYTIIHCGLDNLIPFCEYFIIPYYLWFPYMAVVFFYLFFADKKEYFKMMLPLFIGMSLFLIISLIFPNGQNMRPEIDPNKNLFTWLVSLIYSADTPTNIMPSIHVYNSLVIHYGVIHSPIGKEKRWVRIISLIVCVSICLSTVFLKQHSALDGFAAIAMFVVLCLPFYHWKKLRQYIYDHVHNEKKAKTA